MEATARPGSTIGRLGRRTTVLLGVIALVAACSTQGGGGTTTNPPASQIPAATTVATPPGTPPAPADVTLELATDPDLGEYVVGEDGLALYVFLPDEGDTSACNDDCAINWPPLTGAVAAGDGVTGEIGSIARDDGTEQVTLGGAPLYYFMGDEAAGDMNGQGLQDSWYLASAEGTPVGVDDEPDGEKTPCAGRGCY
jgi:predicted lipoprotein with Yx(FWY)xxD motif